MEPIWKVVEIIMDKRLHVIEFHDALHGSVFKRGTGTAIIEAKLAQQYAYRNQTPFYEIFIDLRKAFDTVDRDRCLEILQEYGVGPKMLHLIKHFWDHAQLTCRASGYYGKPFKSSRGTTQGGPLSPRIFNIIVDAVVRAWLIQLFGSDDCLDARHFLALFYIDDGCIGSPDEDLLQRATDILVEMFERVGLQTNVSKTKAMTCIPGRIKTR